jgi:hypothetical protein
MNPIDIAIIAAYLTGLVVVGVWSSKKAARSGANFRTDSPILAYCTIISCDLRVW